MAICKEQKHERGTLLAPSVTWGSLKGYCEGLLDSTPSDTTDPG